MKKPIIRPVKKFENPDGEEMMVCAEKSRVIRKGGNGPSVLPGFEP